MSDVCTTIYVVMFNLIWYSNWFQRHLSLYEKKCQIQVYIHELIYQMSVTSIDVGLIRQMLNYLRRTVTESNS